MAEESNFILNLRILKLEDIDDTSSPPQVRLTVSDSGDSITTAAAEAIKGTANYKFKDEEGLDDGYKCHFSVTNAGKKLKINVAVLSKSASGEGFEQYPGVGSIIIDLNESVQNSRSADSEVLTCRLLEDGDEMLEIGTMKFKYDVAFMDPMAAFDLAMKGAATDADAGAIDRTAAALEEEERDRIAVIPTETDRQRIEQHKKTPVPHGATIQSFSPQQQSEEVRLVATADVSSRAVPTSATDAAAAADFDDTDDLNADSQELVVVPTTVAAAATDDDDDAIDRREEINEADDEIQYANEEDDFEDADAAAESPTTAAAATAADELDLGDVQWIAAAEKDSNPIIDFIRRDIGSSSAAMSKFIVRLQAVICSYDAAEVSFNATNAVAKLCVLPLPGKITTLRSAVLKTAATAATDPAKTKAKGLKLFETTRLSTASAAVAEDGSSSSGVAQLQSTLFSFGAKSATLSMGPGDVRSRVFKEGGCPTFDVEVSFSGGGSNNNNSSSEVRTARGAVYLPALLANYSGKVLSLPLVMQQQQQSSFTATLILEVNPTGNSSSAIMSDKSLLASASSSATSAATTAAAAGAVEEDTASLDLEMLGLVGSGLETYPALPRSNNAHIDATLAASGRSQRLSLAAAQLHASILSFPQSQQQQAVMSLQSKSPSIDILQLRVASGTSSTEEIARLQIPVAALLEMSAGNSRHNPEDPVAVNFWKLAAAATNTTAATATAAAAAAMLANFKMVSRLYCIKDEDPAPADDSAPIDNSNNNNNNWMADSFAASPIRPTTAGSFAAAASGPPPVKSVSGQLIGCIQGFFSSSGQLSQLSKKSSLVVELTLLPGGIKKTQTGPALVVDLRDTDLQHSVEWSSSFHMALAWALQQRQVACLHIALVEIDAHSKSGTKPTATTAAATAVSRTILGDHVLDLSTVVSYPRSPVISFLLPLSKHASSSLLAITDQHGIRGWLCMALQFHSATAAATTGASSHKQHCTAIEQSSKALWSELLLYPSTFCLGLSSNAAAAPALAERLSQRHPSKIASCSVHIALSTLQFAAATASDLLLPTHNGTINGIHNGTINGTRRSNQDEDCFVDSSYVTCVFKCANDVDNAVAAVTAHVVTDAAGKPTAAVWDCADVVVKFSRQSDISPFVYVYLLRGRYLTAAEAATAATTAADAATVIGESNLVLSNNDFRKGVPLNFALPFRDKDIQRMAVLTMSVQATTLADNSNSSSSNSDAAVVGSQKGAIPLRIEICEGNISSAEKYNSSGEADHRTCPVEPFFECSLLRADGSFDLDIPPSLCSNARTGFVSLNSSSSLDQQQQQMESPWGLDCTVYLPTSFAQPATAPKVNVVVVCRDASRAGCPQLGWARMSLPNTLVSRRKPVEQWLTLSPPTATTSYATAVATATGAAATTTAVSAFAPRGSSRVKLRLTASAAAAAWDLQAWRAPFGVGAVLFRLLTVSDARAGINDALVAAKASSIAWPVEETDADNAVNDAAGITATTAATTTAATDEDITTATTAAAVPLGSSGSSNNGSSELLFSQVQARPALYVNEMRMFSEDVLVGSLPVSGGFSDVRLDVKTLASNCCYTASFPVMATITRAAAAAAGEHCATMPAIPMLNIALHRSTGTTTGTSTGNATGSAVVMSQRFQPKLQLEAAFVPYVSGQLIIHCAEVSLVEDSVVAAAKKQRKHNNSNSGGSSSSSGGKFLGAIRYLLGNNTSRFVFSKPFSVGGKSTAATAGHGSLPYPPPSPVPSNGTAARRALNKRRTQQQQQQQQQQQLIAAAEGDPLSLKNNANITVMHVSTFDLISSGLQREEAFSLLPLFVNLLQLRSEDDNTSAAATSAATAAAAANVSQECVGVGYISTAALYYQAMRAAASSHMDADQSNNKSSNNNNSGGGAVIGASPWLVASVDLFDPTTRRRIAVLSLNIRFVIDAVETSAVNLLQLSLQQQPPVQQQQQHQQQQRTELGLKQSFMVADEDRSGAVSSSELLKVIKRANASGGKPVVGMESALQLLLSLAKPPTNTATTTAAAVAVADVSEEELEAMVSRIFQQLDVDGDGSVSWWEWKTVLTSSLSGRNPQSKFTDPSDALVIGMLAAHAALSTLKPQPLLLQLQLQQEQHQDAALQAMFPFIRLLVRDPHSSNNNSSSSALAAVVARGGAVGELNPLLYDTNPAIDVLLDDDNDFTAAAGNSNSLLSLSLPLPPSESKTVTRLKSKVNALRVTNNALAKRFEKALADAEQLAASIDSNSNNNSSNNPLDSAVVRPALIYSELNRDDLTLLERRVLQSEAAAGADRDAFLAAKQRGDAMAQALVELQAAAGDLQQQRGELFSRSEQHSQRIKSQMETHAETLKAAKMQRARRNAAFFALVHFLKSFVVPKMLQKRLLQQRQRLSQKLSNQLVRSRYAEEKKRRGDAAVGIQRVVRGRQQRQQQQQRVDSALLLQRVHRGGQGRAAAAELRAERDRRNAEEAALRQRQREQHAALWIAIALMRFRKQQLQRRDVAARKLQQMQHMYVDRLEARGILADKRNQRRAREQTESDCLYQEDVRSSHHREYLQQRAEDARVNNAAAKIQHAAVNRQTLLSGKFLRQFMSQQQQLFVIGKPPLEEAAQGYWVGFLSTDNTATTAANTAANTNPRNAGAGATTTAAVTTNARASSSSGKGAGAVVTAGAGAHFGIADQARVEKVDDFNRLLDVRSLRWLPPRSNNNNNNSSSNRSGPSNGSSSGSSGSMGGNVYGKTPVFDSQKLPFDHPLLVWLHTDHSLVPLEPEPEPAPQPMPEHKADAVATTDVAVATTAAAATVTAAEVDTAREPEPTPAPEPDPELASDVSSHDSDDSEDTWHKLAAADGSNSNSKGPWMPPIEQCVGYRVNYSEDGREEHGTSGAVVGADIDRGLIAVYYSAEDNNNNSSSSSGSSLVGTSHWLPYKSEYLYWHQDKKLQRAYRRGKRPKLGRKKPRLADLPQRPATLQEAAGYHVAVKEIATAGAIAVAARGVSAELYPGRVVAVDEATNTVRIQFDHVASDPTPSAATATASKGSKGATNTAAVATAAVVEQEDEVSLPFESPDIVWLLPPTIARPSSIESAIGCQVELIDRSKYAKEGDSYPGRVIAVDNRLQTVRILFDAAPVPAYAAAAAVVEEEDVEVVPFMSEDIIWVSQGPVQQQQQQSESTPTAVAAATTTAAEVSMMEEVLAPAHLRDAIGRSVEVRSHEEDAADGDVFAATVVGVDEASNTVKLQFDNGSGDDAFTAAAEEDIQSMPFDSPDIIWVAPPAAAAATPAAVARTVSTKTTAEMQQHRPEQVVDAVGRRVAITPAEAGGLTFTGTVVAINQQQKDITLRFDPDPDDSSLKEDDYLLDLKFEASQLEWLDSPPHSTPSTPPANATGNNTGSITGNAAVSKQRDLSHVIGKRVEVKSHEDGASESDYFPAKVIAVDSRLQLVTVRFDVDEDDPAATGDEETLPFDSTDIVWVDPLNDISSVVGKRVEVKSHEEDASASDYFPGTVIAADNRRQLVTVRFDVDEDDPDAVGDEETLPFDSKDIVWMSTEPAAVPAATTATTGPTVPATTTAATTAVETSSAKQQLLRGSTASSKESPQLLHVESDSDDALTAPQQPPLSPQRPMIQFTRESALMPSLQEAPQDNLTAVTNAAAATAVSKPSVGTDDDAADAPAAVVAAAEKEEESSGIKEKSLPAEPLLPSKSTQQQQQQQQQQLDMQESSIDAQQLNSLEAEGLLGDEDAAFGLDSAPLLRQPSFDDEDVVVDEDMRNFSDRNLLLDGDSDLGD